MRARTTKYQLIYKVRYVHVYCVANTGKGAKVRGDKQERKEKYTGTQDRGISNMEVYPVVQGCTGVCKSADSVQGRCLQVRGKPKRVVRSSPRMRAVTRRWSYDVAQVLLSCLSRLVGFDVQVTGRDHALPLGFEEKRKGIEKG